MREKGGSFRVSELRMKGRGVSDRPRSFGQWQGPERLFKTTLRIVLLEKGRCRKIGDGGEKGGTQGWW